MFVYFCKAHIMSYNATAKLKIFGRYCIRVAYCKASIMLSETANAS